MPKKIWQHFIYKFESDRLKDDKYNITIDLDQARLNHELISLGTSELIRTIYRLKNISLDYQKIQNLKSELLVVKKLSDTKENRKKIKQINAEIDDFLFIPEIINIQFTDTRHYKDIIEKGLTVNNKKYRRLLTGAGMARRSTTMFVEEEFGKILKPILENNRDKNKPLVDAKYNAYYALLSSVSLPVTTPKFCVVKDYEYVKERLVDFVVEVDEGEDYVEERNMPVPNNVFDGMGIISPLMALQWSIDLELDYVPNSFCIRGSYLKGQTVVFDFHKFANEISNNHTIIDAWGNNVDIREIDVILTISQLKLWNCYSSCSEYQKNCVDNNLGWSVSRYTPKKEKDILFTSYQLLQVLDLSEKELQELAEPTISWIEDIIKDPNKTLLYLLGEISNNQLSVDWWNKLNDPILKSLILDKRLLGDSYIKKEIHNSLKKKLLESAMGSLLIHGNWQVAISDPYAFCEWIFGLPVNGLLQNNEHYCKYWIDKGIYKVVGGRSPLTWKSELATLNLKSNEVTNKWFGHLHSGVVLNIHGVDTMLFADSDFDFDLLFTTDNLYFINGASGGKPVTYEKKMPNKNIINEDTLYIADINTMGSKIGLITNLGTTIYSMLSDYEKDTPEYNELIKRLIIVRKLQGNEIDKGKGVLVKGIPEWDKWTRINDEMNDTIKKEIEFKNSIRIWQRPRFFIYLYPKYMNVYKKYMSVYENYSQTLFGISLQELLNKKELSVEEKEVVDNFNKYNEFIDNNSNMGIICRYIEKRIKEIDERSKKHNYDISVYLDPFKEIDTKKLKKLKDLYHKFNNFTIFSKNKKLEDENYQNNNDIKNIDQFISLIRKEMYSTISSNSQELAILGIKLYTDINSSTRFLWKILGNEIVEFIRKEKNKVVIPLLDIDGDIEYLQNNYSLKEVNI